MNSFNSSSHQDYLSQLAARQRLEQLWQGSDSRPLGTSTAPSITPWYKRLGQWLLLALTDSEQIRVWTKITPIGTQWCAYDPARDRHFSGYSESDLRTWLEQRYH